MRAPSKLILVGILGVFIVIATHAMMWVFTNYQKADAAPALKFASTRKHYFVEATINSLSPLLGGKNTINVDNVIILSLSQTYVMNEVILAVNGNPASRDKKLMPQVLNSGIYTPIGSVQYLVLDITDKKYYLIKYGSRTFSIQLVGVGYLDKPNVGTPLEWKFIISEQ